jgi:hypothetical protein
MQKVRKSFCWGSLTFPALWHLLKGFFVSINYLSEKEGFLMA